jgi:hypothetical protein
MDRPRIAYTSRPDATPEAELNVLATVYRFVLDCKAKREVVRPDDAEDHRKPVNKNRRPTCLDR